MTTRKFHSKKIPFQKEMGFKITSAMSYKTEAILTNINTN
ncbi:hypothetical protein FLCH110379_09415 [Flavobacterium chungbukense]